jgi:spermidine synthase
MSLRFSTAIVWAVLSGFLALAWEITWARVFNFASGSKAPVFGYMLASYLAGLALGSLWSRKWQSQSVSWPQISVMVLRANIAAFVVAPITALLAGSLGWTWGLVLVLLSGGFLGVVFPLICHRAVESNAESGARLSWLYLANIVGSGAGSLITGFLLMDWLTLHQISLVLLVVALGWALSIAPARNGRFFVLPLAIAAVSAPAFLSLYERLQYKTHYAEGMKFAQVVESRHGVITVDSSGAVYGNGAYDGVLETQLKPRSWLVRPYILPAVAESMEEVLVIGVASGAWTQILSRYPGVKKITAIELSKGYLEVIRSRDEVSSLLTDPKVEIIIDDGRRWLRRNPQRKFDAIVMNTTHHWREFASALLSQEFLMQVKSHLKPQGIAFWNCTESGRAAKTGMEVFPHTMMVINHCLASNAPLFIQRERWEKALREWRDSDGPLFDTEEEAELQAVLDFVDRKAFPNADDKWTWMDHAMMKQLYEREEIITDDNLGHEFQ